VEKIQIIPKKLLIYLNLSMNLAHNVSSNMQKQIHSITKQKVKINQP